MNSVLIFVIIVMFVGGMLLAYFSSSRSKGKPVQKPIENHDTLSEKVYRLVSEAETEKAIQSLLEAGLPGAGDLQEHHKKVTRELFMGLVTFEQFARSTAQCNAAIIDMLPPRQPSLTATSVEQIITLIKQEQLEEALEILMQTAPEQASLQLGRLNLFKKFAEQELVPDDLHGPMRKRLTHAILSYLNERGF